MPTSLSFTSSYVANTGHKTSVKYKGYLYDPGTDCTWELLAPVQFLTKENSVYHACIGCGPFRDLGRCCSYFFVCD